MKQLHSLLIALCLPMTFSVSASEYASQQEQPEQYEKSRKSLGGLGIGVITGLTTAVLAAINPQETGKYALAAIAASVVGGAAVEKSVGSKSGRTNFLGIKSALTLTSLTFLLATSIGFLATTARGFLQ